MKGAGQLCDDRSPDRGLRFRIRIKADSLMTLLILNRPYLESAIFETSTILTFILLSLESK